MELIIEYWPLLLAIVAAVAVGGIAAIKFIQYPTSEKMDKIRAWLLIAIAEAEKQFGSGTGKLKLAAVYSMFVKEMPDLAKIISFAMFSGLVDEVLEEFKKMLETNENVKGYVEGAE